MGSHNNLHALLGKLLITTVRHHAEPLPEAAEAGSSEGPEHVGPQRHSVYTDMSATLHDPLKAFYCRATIFPKSSPRLVPS